LSKTPKSKKELFYSPILYYSIKFHRKIDNINMPHFRKMRLRGPEKNA